MKDKRLADLNFNDLIQYDGGQPPVQHKYDQPLRCNGYCVNWENKFGIKLNLISHGCDSSDYVQLLGPPPPAPEPINTPILFLLEGPVKAKRDTLSKNSKKKFIERVEFRGFNKKVPVNEYNWTPGCKEWSIMAIILLTFWLAPYVRGRWRRGRCEVAHP
jgi:hypothetical protein